MNTINNNDKIDFILLILENIIHFTYFRFFLILINGTNLYNRNMSFNQRYRVNEI